MSNKPFTGVNKKCPNCNTLFYVQKHRITTSIYCSLSCKGKMENVKIKANCLICNKPFEHISSRVNKAKYCSRKCYHKSQINNGTMQYSCHHCEKIFYDSPSCKRKYCSKQCVNKGSKKQWKGVFSTIRKVMKRRGLINKCQICGYDEHPEILGVHHIDRNRKNNNLENLMTLCPNCHSIEHRKHISH